MQALSWPLLFQLSPSSSTNFITTQVLNKTSGLPCGKLFTSSNSVSRCWAAVCHVLHSWTEPSIRPVSSSRVWLVVGKKPNPWATHLVADLALEVAGGWWTRFAQIPFGLQLLNASYFTTAVMSMLLWPIVCVAVWSAEQLYTNYIHIMSSSFVLYIVSCQIEERPWCNSSQRW